MDLGWIFGKVGKQIMAGVLSRVVLMVVRQISPELRGVMIEGLKAWKIQAATTDNPWDDIVVELLLRLVESE